LGRHRSLGGRRRSHPWRKLATTLIAGAVLAVFPALSGAIAISPPVAETGSASAIKATSATLNGTINPNDADAGATYTFSWGETTSYGTDVTGTTAPGITSANVSSNITGLSRGTKYHYRLCATNAPEPPGGTDCGDDGSFTTEDAPTPITDPASDVTTSEATLHGSVNPNGPSTSVRFRYKAASDTCELSNPAGCPSIGASFNPVSGRTPIAETATIRGLREGTRFIFRLCATNEYDTRCGSDLSFTTNQPPVATLNADKTSGAKPLTVTFNASRSSDPDGSIASWSLDFGDGDSTGTRTDPLPSNLQHPYTTVGSRTATLVVTDNQGGSDSDSEFITVNANRPPVARLSVSPTSGTTPVDVTFDGSASSDPDADTPITSWQIDFGDGSSTGVRSGSPPASFAHTYVYTGTQPNAQVFTARLRVTDSGGVSSTSDATATVTVNPQPTISVADVTVTEGQTANFVITLSAVSTHNITVNYATANGTATAPGDFTTTQGTMTINAGTCGPGTTACAVAVPTIGNSVFDGTRSFTLALSNPSGATLADGSATGTINDDDPQPVVIIEGGARPEGHAGAKVSGPQSWSAGGTLTLAENTTWFDRRVPFFITGAGSAVTKGPYTFTGKNGNQLTGVSPAGSVSTGQIASQPSPMTFDVKLCDAASLNPPAACVPVRSRASVSVDYVTEDGFTADRRLPVKVGQDYIGTSGTVTLGPEGTGEITVGVIGNTISPPNGQDNTRWFFVRLRNPVNAVTKPSYDRVSGVIIEDDAPNPPIATTREAFEITHAGAKVAGTVNSAGAATTAWVEYGTSTVYGLETPKVNLPADNADHPLVFSLAGLAPTAEYHYRVVATHADNAAGYGFDATFTTLPAPPPPPPPPPPGPPPPPPPPPVATTLEASKIYPRQATVSGRVDPRGQVTKVYVEYGEPDAYDLQSTPQTVPAGQVREVAFLLKDLTPATEYQYRIVAVHESDGRSGIGEKKLFTTAALKPMRMTLVGRKMTATPTGRVPLLLTCTGTMMTRCRGSLLLELKGRVVGFASFALRPAAKKRTRLLVKLKQSALKPLKEKRRLGLIVTISYQKTVDESQVLEPRITVLAPRASQSGK
jgi:PKD repeat protein